MKLEELQKNSYSFIFVHALLCSVQSSARERERKEKGKRERETLKLEIFFFAAQPTNCLHYIVCISSSTRLNWTELNCIHIYTTWQMKKDKRECVWERGRNRGIGRTRGKEKKEYQPAWAAHAHVTDIYTYIGVGSVGGWYWFSKMTLTTRQNLSTLHVHVHAEQNVQSFVFFDFAISLYCHVLPTDLKNLCNQCRLEATNLSVPVFRLDVVDEGLGLFVARVVAVTVVVCHLRDQYRIPWL